MMLTKRQHFNRQLNALKAERSSFIPHWRDLSEVILPRSSRFLLTDRNKGDNRNTKIINSTATYAARTLMAGMMSGITNPARPWFQLRIPDAELNDYQPVKMWLDMVRTTMSEIFLKSNLYTTLPGIYRDLGVFGTAAFAVLEDDEKVLRCQAFPVGSYMIATDERGRATTCYREYQMTCAQLVSMFGRDNCTGAVRTAYDNSNYNQWFDVVHLVEPNPDADPRKLSSKFKPYRSVYYEPTAREDDFLRESGFSEYPIMAPRWDVTGEDVYGTQCPGMEALGDVRQLQLEEKRKMEAIAKLVNPPMVAPSSLKSQRASLLPGDVTYVDRAASGQGFEPAYKIEPRIGELMQDIQGVEYRIKRAFYEDLFLLISGDERSNVTAEEIRERQQEKMLQLGPVLTRQNDEMLDPLIDRTFYITLRSGLLPPPPPELQGAQLTVEYVSILQQTMKLMGIGTIERTVNFTSSLLQAFPDAADKINADEVVDAYAEMSGAPPQTINDAATVAKIRAERAQQAQVAQSMAMAQSAANTAQTLGQTPITDDTALGQMAARMQGASQ